MVVAIAKALEEGSRAIMCASTGNTSASAAAFGAYSGLPALVIIPRGEVAMGKLAQAMAYGARIIMVNGNFDTALDLVRTFTTKHEVTLVNSVNPYRLEGAENGCLRGGRRSRRCARLSVHPGGQCGKYHRLLAGIP